MTPDPTPDNGPLVVNDLRHQAARLSGELEKAQNSALSFEAERDGADKVAAHWETEAKKATAACAVMSEALVRLRDCDWVITPMDRMDAVRDIARNTLAAIDSATGEGGNGN